MTVLESCARSNWPSWLCLTWVRACPYFVSGHAIPTQRADLSMAPLGPKTGWGLIWENRGVAGWDSVTRGHLALIESMVHLAVPLNSISYTGTFGRVVPVKFVWFSGGSGMTSNGTFGRYSREKLCKLLVGSTFNLSIFVKLTVTPLTCNKSGPRRYR